MAALLSSRANRGTFQAMHANYVYVLTNINGT